MSTRLQDRSFAPARGDGSCFCGMKAGRKSRFSAFRSWYLGFLNGHSALRRPYDEFLLISSSGEGAKFRSSSFPQNLNSLVLQQVDSRLSYNIKYYVLRHRYSSPSLTYLYCVCVDHGDGVVQAGSSSWFRGNTIVFTSIIYNIHCHTLLLWADLAYLFPLRA